MTLKELRERTSWEGVATRMVKLEKKHSYI